MSSIAGCHRDFAKFLRHVSHLPLSPHPSLLSQHPPLWTHFPLITTQPSCPLWLTRRGANYTLSYSSSPIPFSAFLFPFPSCQNPTSFLSPIPLPIPLHCSPFFHSYSLPTFLHPLLPRLNHQRPSSLQRWATHCTCSSTRAMHHSPPPLLWDNSPTVGAPSSLKATLSGVSALFTPPLSFAEKNPPTLQRLAIESTGPERRCSSDDFFVE
jgi:hypothetical protein